MIPYAADYPSYGRYWPTRGPGARSGRSTFRAPSRKRRRSNGPSRRQLTMVRAPALKQELKYIDFASTDPVPTGFGLASVQSLNDVPNGTGKNDRIGRKIVVRSVQMTGFLRVKPDGDDAVRIIIGVDKQNNGSGTGSAEFLDDTLAGIHAPVAFRNLTNSNRFQMLHDKLFAMNLGAQGQAATRVIPKFFKKCYIPIEFDGEDGIISEIQSNNIFLHYVSVRDLTSFTFSIRLRYTDG